MLITTIEQLVLPDGSSYEPEFTDELACPFCGMIQAASSHTHSWRVLQNGCIHCDAFDAPDYVIEVEAPAFRLAEPRSTHHVANIGYECCHCETIRAEFPWSWTRDAHAIAVDAIEDILQCGQCYTCGHRAGVRQVGNFYDVESSRTARVAQ